MSTSSTKAVSSSTVATATMRGKGLRYAPLVLGWLVPGGGHFLLGKWVRGALILVSVATMFFLGIAMQGKMYGGASNVLDLLGLAGDIGSGLCFFVSKLAGWGAETVQVTTADYGTRFMVMAGLLNMMAAVDAHNLSIGRKQDMP